VQHDLFSLQAGHRNCIILVAREITQDNDFHILTVNTGSRQRDVFDYSVIVKVPAIFSQDIKRRAVSIGTPIVSYHPSEEEARKYTQH
jgi:hypothetical protein